VYREALGHVPLRRTQADSWVAHLGSLAFSSTIRIIASTADWVATVMIVEFPFRRKLPVLLSTTEP
jgi:hypothetical protein